MQPMLATKGTHVPTGAEWLHEVKWDGVRILADLRPGSPLRMWSRNGNDVTVAWPELSTSPLGERDLLVDGEVIALNDAGLPDFRVLQDRMHVRRARTAEQLSRTVPATFMVFDLLRLDGDDLTALPLERRPRAAVRSGARLHLAGARVVRRRADAVRRHAAAGAGGDRQQAAQLALRLRPALARTG